MNVPPLPPPQDAMVLVDFDNIEHSLRQKGVFAIVWKLLEKLVDIKNLRQPRYIFRLYGGWYEKHQLTRQAQNLNLDISTNIPGVVNFVINNVSCKVPVTVELAYSLAVLPSKPLLATFRPRSLQSKIHCHAPSAVGCKSNPCPMDSVHTFFQNQRCHDPQCTFTMQSFLFKGEQKLVDSMMLSDLIHYTRVGPNTLALVSSDDDLWPGIFSALIYGARIQHVRTRPAPKNSYGYSSNLPATYSVSSL